MFKLPVCPHCGTVYRYKDTARAVVKKENECYHCHKRFKTKIFPYVLIEAAIWIAVSIGMNLLILSRATKLDLALLFAVTIVFLSLIAVFVPFFTRFVKTEEAFKKSNHRKNKK